MHCAKTFIITIFHHSRALQSVVVSIYIFVVFRTILISPRHSDASIERERENKNFRHRIDECLRKPGKKFRDSPGFFLSLDYFFSPKSIKTTFLTRFVTKKKEKPVVIHVASICLFCKRNNFSSDLFDRPGEAYNILFC